MSLRTIVRGRGSATSGRLLEALFFRSVLESSEEGVIESKQSCILYILLKQFIYNKL